MIFAMFLINEKFEHLVDKGTVCYYRFENTIQCIRLFGVFAPKSLIYGTIVRMSYDNCWRIIIEELNIKNHRSCYFD